MENGDAEAWGIDTDSRGNVYWATNQQRPGYLQGLDILLYKLDANGNEQWASPTLYGGQHAQQVYKVTATDSIVYIAGRNCTRFTLDPELPFCDMLIIAVDAMTGDTLWATTWDRGFGYEEVDGLVVTRNGIYVSGWSVGDNTDTDIGLLKLDPQGELVWANSWGTPGRDHQDGHSVVDDSVIYVAGLLDGPTNPGACLIKDYNGKALLAKFSIEDGAYIEHVAFGRDDPWCNFENTLGMASDGQFLFAVGVTTIAANDGQIFLKKFDKDLNPIWETEWGGGDTESSRAVGLDAEGNIFVAGNTKSFGAGNIDVALLKFSPAGQLLWYKTWGAAEDDQVLDMEIDGETIYITGKTQSFHTNGRQEAFLLKTSTSPTTGAHEAAPVIRHFSIEQNYPNPFNPSTTIRFTLPVPSQLRLEIYNSLGQHVRTMANSRFASGRHELQWDGADDLGRAMESGVYFVRLRIGNSTQTRKLTLLR